MTALLAVALLAGQPVPGPPAVGHTLTDTELRLTVGDQPVTTYRFAGEVADEKGTGSKPLAKPFFHPLRAGPGGPPVTRDWPQVRGAAGETRDHFHQKSVWFCHGDVEPGWFAHAGKSADGRAGAVNFWTEAAGHGRIVHTGFGDVSSGGGGLRVPETLQWRTADGRPVLDEARVIGLRDAGPGVLLTLDVTLTATHGPVTFGDTKEGAFGVRVHDDLRAERKAGGGAVTSSDGTAATAPAKDNLPVWGKGADWHDVSGSVGGRACGVAVFDHPLNQPRAAFHTRAYGLLAANPFGRTVSGFPLYAGRADLVKLAKGESLRLRYAVYAHPGDAAGGEVAGAFAGFGKP